MGSDHKFPKDAVEMYALIKDQLHHHTLSEIDGEITMLRQEGIMDNFIEGFRNTITSISNNFTKTIASFSSSKEQATLSGFYKDAKKIIHDTDVSRFNYVTHAEFLVPIPDGFKGNWLEYNQTIENGILQSILKDAKTVLDEFELAVTLFVSDKNSKISTKDYTTSYAIIKKTREQRETLLQSFFTSGFNQRAKVADIFNNAQEITKAAEVSLRNWDVAHNFNVSDMQNQIRKIANRIDQIIELCSSKNDIEVSKQALLNIATAGNECGYQAEAVGKLLARTDINLGTCSNIAEAIKRKTK